MPILNNHPRQLHSTFIKPNLAPQPQLKPTKYRPPQQQITNENTPPNTNNNYNYSETLLSQKTFYFQTRTSKLDLTSISRLNLSRIITETDVNTLQGCLENVCFGSLGEDELKCYSDEVFLKLFGVCQLTLEYLLNVQETLSTNIDVLAKKYTRKKRELGRIEDGVKERDGEIERLKGEGRRRKKTIAAYEAMLKSAPAHAAPSVDKNSSSGVESASDTNAKNTITIKIQRSNTSQTTEYKLLTSLDTTIKDVKLEFVNISHSNSNGSNSNNNNTGGGVLQYNGVTLTNDLTVGQVIKSNSNSSTDKDKKGGKNKNKNKNVSVSSKGSEMHTFTYIETKSKSVGGEYLAPSSFFGSIKLGANKTNLDEGEGDYEHEGDSKSSSPTPEQTSLPTKKEPKVEVEEDKSMSKTQYEDLLKNEQTLNAQRAADLEMNFERKVREIEERIIKANEIAAAAAADKNKNDIDDDDDDDDDDYKPKPKNIQHQQQSRKNQPQPIQQIQQPPKQSSAGDLESDDDSELIVTRSELNVRMRNAENTLKLRDFSDRARLLLVKGEEEERVEREVEREDEVLGEKKRVEEEFERLKEEWEIEKGELVKRNHDLVMANKEGKEKPKVTFVNDNDDDSESDQSLFSDSSDDDVDDDSDEYSSSAESQSLKTQVRLDRLAVITQRRKVKEERKAAKVKAKLDKSKDKDKSNDDKSNENESLTPKHSPEPSPTSLLQAQAKRTEQVLTSQDPPPPSWLLHFKSGVSHSIDLSSTSLNNIEDVRKSIAAELNVVQGDGRKVLFRDDGEGKGEGEEDGVGKITKYLNTIDDLKISYDRGDLKLIIVRDREDQEGEDGDDGEEEVVDFGTVSKLNEEGRRMVGKLLAESLGRDKGKAYGSSRVKKEVEEGKNKDLEGDEGDDVVKKLFVEGKEVDATLDDDDGDDDDDDNDSEENNSDDDEEEESKQTTSNDETNIETTLPTTEPPAATDAAAAAAAAGVAPVDPLLRPQGPKKKGIAGKVHKAKKIAGCKTS